MTKSAWRPKMPEDTVYQLQSLAAMGNTDEYIALLKSCYAAGWSLVEIGNTVGVTRERIRQLITRSVPVSMLSEVEVKPPYPKKAFVPRPPKKTVRELVSDSDLKKMRKLYLISRHTNGATPVGDIRRTAGDELCQMALRVIEETGVSVSSLSRAIGGSEQTLRSRLGRRGLAELPPSQKSSTYKNRQTDFEAIKREQTQKKTHCRRGHELSGDNLGLQGPDKKHRFCKACQRASARALYESRKANPDD